MTHQIVRAALAAAAASFMFAGMTNLLAAQAQTGKNDTRAAIAASQTIPPGGINELKAVELGGIKQWISVRGNDAANPILLFIHGGPGSPMMGESWTFQRPWEDFFTVVQWDQRGAGKTFSEAHRKVDKSMSIERMQADAEELVQLLRESYGKKKIFLLGHSWGSVLGVRVAQHRPEWLYAYIGVGQVVNMQRNEAVGYELTLEQARAQKNAAAIKELESIAPYPRPDGTISISSTAVERKWDVAFGGMLYGQQQDDEHQRWAISPLYTDYDVKSAGLGEESTVGVLWSQLGGVSFDAVTGFKCPVFIFAGAHDRTTPTTLAKGFFDRVSAPEKKFFEIQRASHYVFDEAPGEFLMDLVTEVRPLSEHAE